MWKKDEQTFDLMSLVLLIKLICLLFIFEINTIINNILSTDCYF